MSTTLPIRISIVNDYEVIVRGLAAMLAPFGDRVTVVETEAGGLPDLPADIALFDTFAGRRRSLSRVDELAHDTTRGTSLPTSLAMSISDRSTA